MTIFVLVPVFNRLVATKNLLGCLRVQRVSESMKIVVVNDGSTDGTDQWLTEQSDVEVISGDGSLFWGGAVAIGIRQLLRKAAPDDWILLINNDTTVGEDFVQGLLKAAKKHAPAAVGSVIRDENPPFRLLSIGPRIDRWRLSTADLLTELCAEQLAGGVVQVDALSGRGVLYPVAGLAAAGGMRPWLLPHYFADYELSLRVRKQGLKLLVCTGVAVHSSDDYGSTARALSWFERYFSIRSPMYLPALVAFWWGASNWQQRMSLPLRMALFAIFPTLRRRDP